MIALTVNQCVTDGRMVDALRLSTLQDPAPWILGILAQSHQPIRSHAQVHSAARPRRPKHRYQAEASSRGRERYRLDPFVLDQSVSVDEAGQDVFPVKPGIALQKGVEIVTCREHSKDMLDGDAASAHNRFAPEDLWIDCNAPKKLVISHGLHHRFVIRLTDRDFSPGRHDLNRQVRCPSGTSQDKVRWPCDSLTDDGVEAPPPIGIAPWSKSGCAGLRGKKRGCTTFIGRAGASWGRTSTCQTRSSPPPRLDG
jgi:hypothetical protein